MRLHIMGSHDPIQLLCSILTIERGWVTVVRIELVLVELIAEEMAPLWRVEVGSSIGIKIHGGEPVVEHDVELSGNAMGYQIEDKGHSGRMFGRVTNVLAAVGPWGPTRQFLSVLNAWVQDIDWGSPNV